MSVSKKKLLHYIYYENELLENFLLTMNLDNQLNPKLALHVLLPVLDRSVYRKGSRFFVIVSVTL